MTTSVLVSVPVEEAHPVQVWTLTDSGKLTDSRTLNPGQSTRVTIHAGQYVRVVSPDRKAE